MEFSDQSHINRVRDALWRRFGNGATVMVGSGFSRNALTNPARLWRSPHLERRCKTSLWRPLPGRRRER